MSRTRSRLGLALMLCLLTLVRLAWIGRYELTPDEAYYLQWSKRLDLAYFSKGPGIALLVRGATALGGVTEWGIRWPAPLIMLAATLMLWVLTRELFGERVATVTALVLQAIPLVNGGALLMTIDAPSIFMWVLALWLGWRAIVSGRLCWWIATGAAVGVGGLFKYTNLALLAGFAVVAVLWAGERRRLFVGTLLAALVALACVSPALWWNASHGWVTAAHLARRGHVGRDALLRPGETLKFLGAHLLVWSPMLFVGLVVAVALSLRRSRSSGPASADGGVRYLLAMSLPLVVGYAVLALHEAGEANWTAPGIVGLVPVAMAWWLPRLDASRALRGLAMSGVALAAGLSVIGADTDLLRYVGVTLSPAQDPSTRVRGWRTTAQAVRDVRRSFERDSNESVLLVANQYGLASELAFYLPDARVDAPGHPPVHVPPSERARSEYSYWPGLDDPALVGRSALFVTNRIDGPPPAIVAAFESFAPLDTLQIRRRGEVIREIRVYVGQRLRAGAGVATSGQ